MPEVALSVASDVEILAAMIAVSYRHPLSKQSHMPRSQAQLLPCRNMRPHTLGSTEVLRRCSLGDGPESVGLVAWLRAHKAVQSTQLDVPLVTHLNRT